MPPKMPNRYKIGRAAVDSGWSPVQTGPDRMVFARGGRAVSVNFRPDEPDEIVSAFDDSTAIKGRDMTAAVVAALRKG